MKPTVISTFAGAGGSSLGYRLAGYDERLAVEWDDNAVATFRANFPDVPVYHGDIAALSSDECMRLARVEAGELDVLDGSPPCQGFSTAGRRRFDDPRNSLFIEYARLVRDLQPRVFVMENVTGMVKGHMKQAYLEIAAELRACGYRVKGAVMNAMYFDVPQSRERVIILGARNDLGIQPTHPLPQTRPIPLARVIPDATASRSQNINPWIPATRPACTITKTQYKGLLRTKAGVREPTLDELKALGSFPGPFTFAGGKMRAWERIGNSVPPNLMRAIATHVRDHILNRATQQEKGGA